MRDTVDAIYRTESRRVLATLIRLLGDFDLAEEALHDAFVAAVERWPSEGVPANPRAWLVSTGRFKAIDVLRRRARFDRSCAALAVSLAQQSEVLARQLPYRVKLSRLDLATVGDDDEEFVRETRQFEQLLPPLMLNIALLTLDGVSADVCMESPFPVPEAAVEPA